MKEVFGKVLIWLVIVNLFALLFLNRLNLAPDTAYDWISPQEFHQEKTWDLVSIHSRWDSKWYLDIAENGYSYQEDQLSNIVFFPLYPLLIRVLSVVFLGNFVLAGWLLSIGSLLGAVYYLKRLVSQFHPEIHFNDVLLYLLVFPTAFVLNTVYTESLFLLLSIACFYYAFKKDFIKASVLALLGSLTRVTGVLLFIPMVIEFIEVSKLQSCNVAKKKFLNPKILLTLSPILGFLSVFIFHWIKFGDFFLFFKVQSTWGKVPFEFNPAHFQIISDPALVNMIFDLGFVGLTVWGVFQVFKKNRLSYALYLLAGILLPLISGSLMSFGRYLSVLFPIYLLLAQVKNQNIKFGIIMVFILMLGLDILLWVNNYWVF